MISIPYFTKNMLLESIEIACILKENPATIAECYAVSVVHHKNKSSMLFYEAML